MQVPDCSWSKLSSASKGCFNELKTFKFAIGRTVTPGQLAHKPSDLNHIKGDWYQRETVLPYFTLTKSV